MPRLPRLAILTGVAGLIPFLALGLLSVLPDRGLHAPALLIGYGAVILSFLGGVHEGFAILAPAPLPGAPLSPGDWQRAERARLAGASACSLVGWLALALAAFLPPATPLLVLILALGALVMAEQRATRRGWMPRAYMWLRWSLSAIVLAVLVAVLALRLLGSAT